MNEFTAGKVTTKQEAYKQTRKELGLTQEAMATKLGIPRTSISKRESGLLEISKEANLALEYIKASTPDKDGYSRIDFLELIAQEAETLIATLKDAEPDTAQGEREIKQQTHSVINLIKGYKRLIRNI